MGANGGGGGGGRGQVGGGRGRGSGSCPQSPHLCIQKIVVWHKYDVCILFEFPG